MAKKSREKKHDEASDFSSVIPARLAVGAAEADESGNPAFCRPELVSESGSRVTRLARRACESRREPGMTTRNQF